MRFDRVVRFHDAELDELICERATRNEGLNDVGPIQAVHAVGAEDARLPHGHVTAAHHHEVAELGLAQLDPVHEDLEVVPLVLAAVVVEVEGLILYLVAVVAHELLERFLQRVLAPVLIHQVQRALNNNKFVEASFDQVVWSWYD